MIFRDIPERSLVNNVIPGITKRGNVKIVKFKNGKYSIRKRSMLFFVYLYTGPATDRWWFKSSPAFERCLGTLPEIGREFATISDIEQLKKDKGEVLSSELYDFAKWLGRDS